MPAPALGPPFDEWFASRGWAVRPHQHALAARAAQGLSSLLIAPTGAGKTLAGFLPSLIGLHGDPAWRGRRALHTLYVSPLKALAADIARNLEGPVAEMGLDVRIETRTGDTPPAKRQRQRAHPPHILLTTPEQLSLLIASPHPRVFFEDLEAVIVDEAHALAPTKRGDLLALALERLRAFAPAHRRIGLSATVADPLALAAWVIGPEAGAADIVRAAPGAAPKVEVLDARARIPWSGHMARHAMPEIYEAIAAARLALVFVNTRAQAELTFQELWHLNDRDLPIALHHGSLDVAQRRKVETAMAAGRLRAVVCTSTLDLGIDWGDVDLVIQVGAPKGASRLIQRIGRANHRLDEPSRALLAPSNRFEVLECRAAQAAVEENVVDGDMHRIGALDCLAQHIMTAACGEPFSADALFNEVKRAAPYAALPRATFDRALSFVEQGGYALRAYDRFKRIVQDPATGQWRVRTPLLAQKHRMNTGAILESEMLDVVFAARGGAAHGRRLGRIEEWFIESLTPGDTFLFAGLILRFEGLRDDAVLVSRAAGTEPPAIPSYAGGKFPLSTFLAARVRALIADRAAWRALPAQVREWLRFQEAASVIPAADEMLVEAFPRAGKYYLVCYPFEGRLAHQTLGMLLTRRLARAGLRPMGFVASEYALSIWALNDLSRIDAAALFDEDMLGDDLDAWLAESALMKRSFRACAVIAGMIERKSPGAAKSGRQVTFSTDLIYDVLREHEPGHLLLEAALNDAGEGLLDVRRLGALLARIRGRLRFQRLEAVSPFAVPLMLEIGREPILGAAEEAALDEAGEALAEEAPRARA